MTAAPFGVRARCWCGRPVPHTSVCGCCCAEHDDRAHRTDTVRLRIIDGELAAPPRTRRHLRQRIRTSPLADDLRAHQLEVGIVVGLIGAVLLIVAGSWLHALAAIDLTAVAGR